MTTVRDSRSCMTLSAGRFRSAREEEAAEVIRHREVLRQARKEENERQKEAVRVALQGRQREENERQAEAERLRVVRRQQGRDRDESRAAHYARQDELKQAHIARLESEIDRMRKVYALIDPKSLPKTSVIEEMEMGVADIMEVKPEPIAMDAQEENGALVVYGDNIM